MKNLHKDNPFPITNPRGLIWEYLKSSGGFDKNLDYGAYDGALSTILANDNLIRSGICVDINKEAVESGQALLHKNLELVHILKHQNLPFDDETFDSVIISGVLEHIYDQGKILKEFNRVLKKDGELIITVPGKSLCSFLDPGNWKFVFPRIHKIYYTLAFSAEKYHERYVECKNGLIGDIEVEKRWHQHFTSQEMDSLVKQYGFVNKFETGRGYFIRAFVILDWITFGLLNFLIEPIKNLDSKIFSSDELMFVFRKTS